MKFSFRNDLTNSLLASFNTAAFSIERMDGFSVSSKWAEAATGQTFAAAAVSVANNTATVASHGLQTGVKVQLTTSNTLPGGLSLLTDYWIIVVDANTIKFATTLNNANSGTAVDITNQGIGTTTVTTTAGLVGAMAIEVSNDAFLDNGTENTSAQWDEISGSSTAVGSSGQQTWNISSAYYTSMRVKYTATSGYGHADIKIRAKGII